MYWRVSGVYAPPYPFSGFPYTPDVVGTPKYIEGNQVEPELSRVEEDVRRQTSRKLWRGRKLMKPPLPNY